MAILGPNVGPPAHAAARVGDMTVAGKVAHDTQVLHVLCATALRGARRVEAPSRACLRQPQEHTSLVERDGIALGFALALAATLVLEFALRN